MQQTRNKMKLLQPDRGHLQTKPTASNIYNDETVNAFSLISETREGYPPLPFLFNKVLEVLARTI